MLFSFFWEYYWNALRSKIEFEDWLMPSECGDETGRRPIPERILAFAEEGVAIELMPQLAGPLLEVLEPR